MAINIFYQEQVVYHMKFVTNHGNTSCGNMGLQISGIFSITNMFLTTLIMCFIHCDELQIDDVVALGPRG